MKNIVPFLLFFISSSLLFAQKDNLKDALKQVQELKNKNSEPTTSTVLEPNEDMALVSFKVTDPKNVAEQDAKVTISGVGHTFEVKGLTDIDGKFDVLMPEGKKYTVKVEKFGKVFDFNKPEDVINIPSMLGEIAMEQNLVISVITKYIRKFKIENLYFDSNKWEVKQESKGELDKLYEIISISPNMRVEIAGHTDNVGDDATNMRLSQNRANAVRDYLVSKGLNTDRLVPKGYGETSPETTNETAEGRQQNRRTEVRVITE